MNETVDDQLAHDGIAGAEGEVSFHKKAVWKMFPAEPGDLVVATSRSSWRFVSCWRTSASVL